MGERRVKVFHLSQVREPRKLSARPRRVLLVDRKAETSAQAEQKTSWFLPGSVVLFSLLRDRPTSTYSQQEILLFLNDASFLPILRQVISG